MRYMYLSIYSGIQLSNYKKENELIYTIALMKVRSLTLSKRSQTCHPTHREINPCNMIRFL